ncbi:hypothetical protein L1987_28446 [Smallanthus sonchifolius]|uniref:Uncharacterized protein n=1 Tax=Smallanthus sonchifolius TaxID=185202 RepID=A0ACB9HYG6_9ASTR|nr:hypothetical protein L1987_28446 [Smallanthus sonchifolius]
MDGEQQQIVPYTHLDYVDTLEPGYRFCPTDLELIVYYLKRKIELGEHPKGRLYDVNVYDHHPIQLTGCYPSCDDKWYFFTMREPKYAKGTRVNRRTKDFGHWRSSQTDATVYDFATRRGVGKKRLLAFHDEKNRKTSWLMHEYTYNRPNLPSGSHVNKIYKKVSTRIVKNNQMDQHHDDDQTNHHLGKNPIQPLSAFHDPNDQGFPPEQVRSFSTCEYYQNRSMSTSTINGSSRFTSGASSSREMVEECCYNPFMDATDDDSLDPQDYKALLSLDEDDERDFTSFDELMRGPIP